jgi:DNA-directed RNA polymerase subunit RPC12/RpoP
MDKTYENICTECSKPFETKEQEATICPECWNKLINLKNEGKG